MSLKNKCHAHKPCKGKGSYDRHDVFGKLDKLISEVGSEQFFNDYVDLKGECDIDGLSLAEMEQMIVDSSKVSLYLEGVKITDQELDRLTLLAEPISAALLEKLKEN